MADIFDTGEPVPVQPKESGPSQLVKKVRAKYPEYSDLSDDELEAKVLAKYPEYADLASNKAKMAVAAERSVQGAESGRMARSEAPDPMSPEGFYGGRGPDGELVTPEFAANQAKTGLSVAASVVPFAAGRRVAGAAFGGYEGYKAGGLPGAVAGAATGAVAPGTTGTAILGMEGYKHGGVPGAIAAATVGHVLPKATGVAAALLLKKYGAATLTKLLATKFGSQILEEGMAAAKAATEAPGGLAKIAELTKGVNPEAVASIEKVFLEAGASPATAKAVATAEAARGAASGAEASLQGLPGVVGKAGELSQEQLKMVMQLQAMAKQGGQSRQAVARAAKEMFPNNPEVIEMITGPITRMPSVSIPR